MFGSSLIQFIIFILPGYVAISIYRYKFPVRLRADNRDIIWGMVYGLLQFSLLVKLFPEKMQPIFSNGTENSAITNSIETILLIIVSGFIFGLLGILLSLFRDKILYKSVKLRKFRKAPQSIWHKINTEKEFKNSWAVVFLDDGAIYRGYIKYYQFNPDLEIQDFLLARADRVDENLKKKYSISGQGLYLTTATVKRIELLY